LTLINKKDKIFVAGHQGMVGSSICRLLKKKGYNFILKENRFYLDLKDKYAVQKWFDTNKPTVVIIAAARVGGIYANEKYPVDFILDNLKIQNNLIEQSWQSNVKRLLFLGSSCIYPKFSKQPIKEEYLLSGNLEATNEYYALAKITGIKLCEALRKQHDFDAISLMPCNLYGPGDNYHPKNSHVIPALIRKFYEAIKKNEKFVNCWGTGSPLREFLHVDDLANACIFALENWDPNHPNSPRFENGETLSYLNVGSGIDQSIKSLAIEISKIIKFKGEINWDLTKKDGTPKKLLDTSRINKLGWNSNISIKEGLDKTIKSFIEDYEKNNLRK
tara:strand:+ start:269 stop:1264 length:996 start_codon:yes stop_codon:yes gene_type:complete